MHTPYKVGMYVFVPYHTFLVLFPQEVFREHLVPSFLPVASMFEAQGVAAQIQECQRCPMLHEALIRLLLCDYSHNPT